MPTELKAREYRVTGSGENIDTRYSFPYNVGFCKEAPKYVLGILYRNFRIEGYKEIGFPFGRFFNNLDVPDLYKTISPPFVYFGLIILEARAPKGTEIIGKLEDFEEELKQFKMRTKVVNAELIMATLPSTMGSYLGCPTTENLFNQKYQNYLLLSKEERTKYAKKGYDYDARIAGFKEIIEVTLNIPNPTEEDLRTILSGKTPKR